jgi:hypothetical protein
MLGSLVIIACQATQYRQAFDVLPAFEKGASRVYYHRLLECSVKMICRFLPAWHQHSNNSIPGTPLDS